MTREGWGKSIRGGGVRGTNVTSRVRDVQTKLLTDLCYPFNVSIGMHIVFTALYAFPKVLTRRLFT